MSRKYKNDSEFRIDVKMIMSFSFLPIELIEVYSIEYEKYIKTRKHYEDINIIWCRFKNLYLKENLNGRKTVFNYSFWSSFKRILHSSPLTTNTIEGWHRSLNLNVKVSHPNIPIFIRELIKEQNKVEYEIFKILHEICSFDSILNSNKESIYENELKKLMNLLVLSI
ncbi:hypothetical protein DMUE_2680 [Dictyocoela muelleri]|nr:hypothetical protein DMUE_2680 [Dictyocoela muelleri]